MSDSHSQVSSGISDSDNLKHNNDNLAQFEKEMNESEFNEFKERIQSVNESSQFKERNSKRKAKPKLIPNISQKWIMFLRNKLNSLVM